MTTVLLDVLPEASVFPEVPVAVVLGTVEEITVFEVVVPAF